MPSVAAEHHKDSARVAAGLRAAIHNPNVSDDARERAVEKLREMGQEVEPPEEHHRARHPEYSSDDPNRVLAGYKATLSNPHTSSKAKAHAQEVLQAEGILEKLPGHTEEEHQVRVLAGYKAALHNPRVSNDAKEHARQYLKEHGVED